MSCTRRGIWDIFWMKSSIEKKLGSIRKNPKRVNGNILAKSLLKSSEMYAVSLIAPTMPAAIRII